MPKLSTILRETSAGAADAGMIPVLDENGLLDSSFGTVGPQGPAGPAGADGAAGATGAAGPSNLIVTSDAVSLTSGLIPDGSLLARSGSTFAGMTLAQIRAAFGLSGFLDVATEINPRHYWRATGTVQSGGLVDTITDVGRVGGKNFTQSGAARCPTATDGLGNTYLAPDGSADYYLAGSSAADFKFLNDGTSWTIGFVGNLNTAPAGTRYLLATYDGGGANSGFLLLLLTDASTLWGPRAVISRSGVGISLDVNVTHLPVANVHCVTIVHHGNNKVAATTPQPIYNRGEVHTNGHLGAYHQSSAGSTVAHTNSNPTASNLALFANTAGASQTAMRLYDLWIDDRAVPQRLLDGYADYAKRTWGSAS